MPLMTRWQALDELQQAGVSVFISISNIPPMGEDAFHRLLSYFRAPGEGVVFHEPINPSGANFQQCLTAAEQACYDDVVEELQELEDSHQCWVEHALEQLNTVQQVAAGFDGLEVHSWPDNERVRLAIGQLWPRLKSTEQAASPFSGKI